MTDEVQRALGRLEARADSTEAWVRQVAEDVKAIKTTVDQAKGGWKVGVALASAGGVIGAVLTKVSAMFWMVPR